MIKVVFEPKPKWEPEVREFEDFTLVSFGKKEYWYKTGSDKLKNALLNGAIIIEREKPVVAQVVNKPLLPANNYFTSKQPWKK